MYILKIGEYETIIMSLQYMLEYVFTVDGELSSSEFLYKILI